MKIETTFAVLSTLLVALGFTTLWLTGQVAPWLSLIFIASLLYALFNDRRERPLYFSSGFWNTLTLLFFTYEVYQAFYSPRELILDVMEFLVFLQVVRLWSKKDDRDYLQIYGIALLHVMSASVLTAEIVFAAMFVIFIIIGTWALVVFNLRREMRMGGLDERRTSALLTGKLFAALTGVAFCVLFGAALIFFLFPRFNYSYFAPLLQKPGSAQSGFSDKVKLGRIGAIKLNQQPVMRVSFSGPMAKSMTGNELYLRGITLNLYDGQQWQAGPSANGRETISVQGFRAMSIGDGVPEQANLITEVVMEPIGEEVLFVIPQVVGLQTPFGIVSHQKGENFTGSFAGTQRVKYIVYSKVGRPERRRKIEVFDPNVFRNELQVPATIDPRVILMARQATASAKTTFDRARLLETYLRGTFGYTLAMGDHTPVDPLAYFLFEKKAGHCEYFASAMTVMLRSLGIPARVVGGYYHGQWNAVGKFFLIRESHAHTWVEAYFPELGWQAFDPTPADPAFGSPTGALDYAREWLESAQLFWVNWIVDYDLQQQRKAVQTLSMPKTSQRTTAASGETPKQKSRWMERLEERLPTLVGKGFAGLIITVFAVQLLRALLRRQRRPKVQTLQFYRRMLKILARRGIRREPAQTPLEFQHAAESQLPQARGPLQALTALFCRVQYGGDELTADDSARAQVWLRELSQP